MSELTLLRMDALALAQQGWMWMVVGIRFAEKSEELFYGNDEIRQVGLWGDSVIFPTI